MEELVIDYHYLSHMIICLVAFPVIIVALGREGVDHHPFIATTGIQTTYREIMQVYVS